jgi:predicted nucleic acid-binding protein
MPDRVVVSNTSPLLYLHQVGQLDLLRRLYGQLIVPAAVAAELAAGSQLGISVPRIEQLPWIQVKMPPERLVLRAIVDLGAGEAEVIAIGMANPGALLLLDDALARRIAALSGLRFTGTIGLLVAAKRAGALESVQPPLAALRKTTIRISDELIRWALEEAGEAISAQ